jgi:inner membrane protein
LFFLALATHWLLDCFTAFGTQIFLPFSDYRVAFNNIAVADPFYTAPFLICTIIASTLRRNTKPRKVFTWLGIGISSLYMLLTIINKQYVDRVFEKALNNRELEITRCRTTPTIFNNFLWACVAEAPDRYYAGQYSIFDSDPNLHYLSEIFKNDSIRQALQHEKDYQTLEWFSDGYLVAFPTDSILYLCDIRFGGMGDTITSQRDLVFNFKVSIEDGQFIFRENREPPQGDFGEQWNKFWTRVWGY